MAPQKKFDSHDSREKPGSSSQSITEVDPEAFPKEGTITEKARFLMNFALLAPSEGSSEPCSFEIVNDTLHMSVANPDRSSTSSVDHRQQYFTLGSALENFTVAANRFEFNHRVSYRPDGPSASVSIDLDPEWTFPSEPSPEQFKQITRGQICADQLEDRSLSQNLVRQIREMPCEDVVNLQFITDTGLISKFLDLQEQLTETDEKRSTTQKQPPNDNHQKKEEAGIWNRIVSFLRSLFTSDEQSKEEEKETDQKRSEIEACDSPSYLPPAVVLSGWTNGPICWIKCGRVSQRIALMTGENGVVIQPFPNVMSNSRARNTVQNLIGTPGNTVAQFLFRLGYGDAEKPTSRSTVDERTEK